MPEQFFPVIDLTATGANIRRLRQARGFTVQNLQRYFGFEGPQAIYKWQRGESLPSVDNLFALSALLGVSMNAILIRKNEQQASACCSLFSGRLSRRAGHGGMSCLLGPYPPVWDGYWHPGGRPAPSGWATCQSKTVSPVQAGQDSGGSVRAVLAGRLGKGREAHCAERRGKRLAFQSLTATFHNATLFKCAAL